MSYCHVNDHICFEGPMLCKCSSIQLVASMLIVLHPANGRNNVSVCWPVTVILAQRSFQAIASSPSLWPWLQPGQATGLCPRSSCLSALWSTSQRASVLMHGLASSFTLMGTKVLLFQSCPIAWGCWSPFARLLRTACANNQP